MPENLLSARSAGADAMTTRNEPGRSRLAIDIEPEQRRRIEAVAQDRDARPSADSAEWSRLSVPAFARDWESAADAVYDELA
jgi:hypothetical protein